MTTCSIIRLVVMCLCFFSDKVSCRNTPEFIEELHNLTVTLGRDATFKCRVRGLGDFRVGWVKADNKAIQAIHLHVITHNRRVRVSHPEPSSWLLHIGNVQLEDAGVYMCQVNSDPMISQYGYLNVVVPPDIVSDQSSSDVIVPEGGSAELTCRAQGHPSPTVRWRREDGQRFNILLPGQRDSSQERRVDSYEGEVLILTKVRRGDTGYFLCIASNGLPPSVSKKVHVQVHFPPVLETQHQLHGAALGSDVTLTCHVQALPKSVNFWIKDPNQMLISGAKYTVIEQKDSEYSTWTSLTIRQFRSEDAGRYLCAAKNSVGQVQAEVQVYEVRMAKGKNRHKPSTRKFEAVYNSVGNHYPEMATPRLRPGAPGITHTPSASANHNSIHCTDFRKLIVFLLFITTVNLV